MHHRVHLLGASELATTVLHKRASRACREVGEEIETGVGVGVGVDAASVVMPGARGRVFECKTCGRRFPTFQALGGHRASHRRQTKPYGGETGLLLLRRTTTKLLLDEPPHELGECAPPPPPPRLHGCSICGLEFAVGQALGGHMRRHRTAAAAAAGDSERELRAGDADDATPVAEQAGAGAGVGWASGICLDLSLAPSSENCAKCRNNVVPDVLGDGNTLHGVRKSLILDCPPL